MLVKRLKSSAAGAYELSVLPQVEHFSTLVARSNAGAERGKNRKHIYEKKKHSTALTTSITLDLWLHGYHSLQL